MRCAVQAQGEEEGRRPPPAASSGFAVGLTLEGGLLMFWPDRGDYQILNKEETALVREVVATKPAPEQTS